MSKKPKGLSVQFLQGIVLSLLLAILIFFTIFTVSNKLLDKTVYGQPFLNQMADKHFDDLKRFVKEENVSLQNLHPLDIWCSRGDKVYLTLYLDDRIIYESFQMSEANLNPIEYDPKNENPENEHTLILADGTKLHTFLYYYSGDAYYYLTIVVSGLIAFSAFCICFVSFVHRKLRYVKHLRDELDILSSGDLHYQITISGNDELSELAIGIDQMRKSILDHQIAEEKMRLANSELVTAMSHDLRTPLTSLLAYLELMENGKYADTQQLEHFIKRSLEKTYLIKSMADKLFEYFLVYSSEWEHPNTELADADELFQQFLGEYIFSLESNGFQIDSGFGELNGELKINFELLRRVFDNIYSNLLKYADRSSPISISYFRKKSEVCLTICNKISAQRDKKESTNIGLNTCKRIMQYHSGTFSVSEENNLFCVNLTLPLPEQ